MTMIDYFSYPFVRYAFFVGVMIALCAALLGVLLVLKRFSYIGDGLSHVAFGVLAVASVLNLTNSMLLVLTVTIFCAVLLLRGGQNVSIKGDAAIAMLSTGALAFGYLLMNLFSNSSNLSGDVCSTLFGSTSILTLTTRDVRLCAVLSLVVVFCFILCYNRFFAVTFDEDFLRATGGNAGRYNLLLSILIAVVITLAMNLVGSLLISALVIFPALSAMRLCKSFRAVTILSAVLSVLSAAAGILLSIVAGTPVGSTIVAVDAVMFCLCFLLGKWGGRRATVLAALMLFMVLLLTGCVSGDNTVVSQTDAPVTSAEEIDFTDGTARDENASGDTKIDLTTMSGTVVYAEVYRMMTIPEDYIGKTVTMRGKFSLYHDEETGKDYYACIIEDATACCAQGIEFEPENKVDFLAEMPGEDDEITVTGTFATYREDDARYITLRNAISRN